LLWDFVRRRIAVGQSLAAIAGRSNPADLTAMAALLKDPPAGIHDEDLTVLPNVLRSQYGALAIPHLEEALQGASSEGIKSQCARELIYANHPTGFRYVLATVSSGNQSDKSSLIQFLREQFLELRDVDETAMLNFLRLRVR
jgi:hypothetical protein